MRAFGYFRPGVEGTPALTLRQSPRTQFETYCRDRDQELVTVFGLDTAGQQGPLPEEEQFNQLLERCSDPATRPDVVVIPESPHLASELNTFIDRVLLLENLGIDVRCTASPLADPLENGLKLLKPSLHLVDRETRIRSAISSKAERGEVLGRTPYGYRIGLDGLLEPRPDEAPVVKEIFQLYSGAGPEGGLGLRRMAAILNRRVLRTRAGRLWTTVSIAGILRNQAYVGFYKRRNVRIPRNHEPIIDQATFDRVQDAMAERRPMRRPRQRDGYALAGLVPCSECGRTLHGLLRARNWVRKDGTPAARSYRYYECPGRPLGGKRHSSFRAEFLESAALDRLEQLAASDSAAGVERRVDIDEGGPQHDVDMAVRRVRNIIRRVAAGNGQIGEFTAARAQLRRIRAKGPRAESISLTLPEAIAKARSSDRSLARRVMSALVESIVATEDQVTVNLRSESTSPMRVSG